MCIEYKGLIRAPKVLSLQNTPSPRRDDHQNKTKVRNSQEKEGVYSWAGELWAGGSSVDNSLAGESGAASAGA
jgi:hypothetical protein